jgi:hypothetical protein
VDLSAVSQHFSVGVFCFATNFAVTIVAAARMIKIKSNFFQSFPFGLGAQHPSLQQQF